MKNYTQYSSTPYIYLNFLKVEYDKDIQINMNERSLEKSFYLKGSIFHFAQLAYAWNDTDKKSKGQ